jgi:hypothetical protein
MSWRATTLFVGATVDVYQLSVYKVCPRVVTSTSELSLNNQAFNDCNGSGSHTSVLSRVYFKPKQNSCDSTANGKNLQAVFDWLLWWVLNKVDSGVVVSNHALIDGDTFTSIP